VRIKKTVNWDAQKEYGKLECSACRQVKNISEFTEHKKICKPCRVQIELIRQADIQCIHNDCNRLAILGEFCHEHWRGRRDQLYKTYPELLVVRRIAEVVANYYGYTADELLYTQNRSEVWNHMRQVAIVLIKDSTNVRDGEIGLVFDRLVSSITHARQSAARRMMSDPKFRYDVTEIWGILEEKNLIQEL
jgi:hypothetical protein